MRGATGRPADSLRGVVASPDGVEIHYQVAGSGSPVLLFHGGLMSSGSWHGQVTRLRADHSVITFDQRGLGASGRPGDAGSYGIEISAADALAVLAATGVQGAHVVGFSVGGMIALAMASAAPARVRSLVLVSTTARLTPTQSELFRLRADRADAAGLDDEVEIHVQRAFAPAFAAANRAMISAYAEGVRANDPQAFAATMRALSRADLLGSLKDVRCPTLVVAGAEDSGMPPAVHAAALQAGIPDARLQVLPAVGHSVHLEVPDAFGRLMLEFFSEVEAHT